MTRAIDFQSPDYLPAMLRVAFEWLHEKDTGKIQRIRELHSRFPDAMLDWLDAVQNLSQPNSENGVPRWIDEWGTGCEDDGFSAKAVSYPLKESYYLLGEYAFPDPELPGRFDSVDLRLQNWGDRYVLASVWFTLFERLWMLRGFDNILIDPYLDEGHFGQLRDRIVEYDLAMH